MKVREASSSSSSDEENQRSQDIAMPESPTKIKAENHKGQESNHSIELERMKKEMWHTGLFVRRPCTVIGSFCLLFAIFLVATVAGKLFEMNEMADREYMVWDDIRTIELDSLLQAEKEVQRSSADKAKGLRS